MLNLIDEHARESLLVRPERRWSSAKVIEVLADVMVLKGIPEHNKVKSGRMSLGVAQRGIAEDWTQYLDAAYSYCQSGGRCGRRRR